MELSCRLCNLWIQVLGKLALFISVSVCFKCEEEVMFIIESVCWELVRRKGGKEICEQ
jgi:hypothetical protein